MPSERLPFSRSDADELGRHGDFDLVGLFFPPLGELSRYTYRVYGHDADGRYVSAQSACDPPVGEPDPGVIWERLRGEAEEDVREMIDAIDGQRGSTRP
jgi:hypothetical protein